MLENRFAWFTVAGTFLLLLIGGTVNPTGSSLACPEPTLVCKGELFPEMTGGVLYEHGHRLVAMTVGMLQIGLTALLWRRRPALRWLGVAALIMVCAQGALGAITVAYKLPWEVSTAHLLLAMAYLATLLVVAWRTRPADPAPRDPRELGSLRRWIAVGGAAVLLQILLGGLMRHHDGALASIDLPLHHGSLWPADAALPLLLHMAHRIGGIVAGTIAIAVAVAVLRRAAGWRGLRSLAAVVPFAVVGQIALGVLTIASLRHVPVAVAHFGGAALLWGTFVAMYLVARGMQPAPARTARPERPLEPALEGA
jgi:heme A synthase